MSVRAFISNGKKTTLPRYAVPSGVFSLSCSYWTSWLQHLKGQKRNSRTVRPGTQLTTLWSQRPTLESSRLLFYSFKQRVKKTWHNSSVYRTLQRTPYRNTQTYGDRLMYYHNFLKDQLHTPNTPTLRKHPVLLHIGSSGFALHITLQDRACKNFPTSAS